MPPLPPLKIIDAPLMRFKVVSLVNTGETVMSMAFSHFLGQLPTFISPYLLCTDV